MCSIILTDVVWWYIFSVLSTEVVGIQQLYNNDSIQRAAGSWSD